MRPAGLRTGRKQRRLLQCSGDEGGAVRASYQKWQSGELTRDGQVIADREEAEEMRRRKRQEDDEEEEGDVVIYGQKKRTKTADGQRSSTDVIWLSESDDEATATLEKALAKADDVQLILSKQKLETPARQQSRVSLGTSSTTERTPSESPEVVEVKGTFSPAERRDSGYEEGGEKGEREGEEGNEAIATIRRLHPQQFAQFDQDIWLHHKRNSQDEETFQWKMRVRSQLLDMIQEMFPGSRLFAVGSTINGCGSFNSDMDLCCIFPDPYHGFDTSRDYAFDFLRRLRNYLLRRGRGGLISQVQLIPAKVPILKLALTHPYQELEVDLNCNNVAGIYNSHLLHYYARVDDRFAALCLIIKHWAIKADINDAMTGTFNSYSLILLVLHYLQCVPHPAVLPNLQHLMPAMFTGQQEPYSLQLFQDFPFPLPGHKANKQSVGELLIGFFNYYSRFDFHKNAISIRRGCVFDRSFLSSDTAHFKIYIEEPFDGKNTARCVVHGEKMRLIKGELTKAAHRLTKGPQGGPSLAAINVAV